MIKMLRKREQDPKFLSQSRPSLRSQHRVEEHLRTQDIAEAEIRGHKLCSMKPLQNWNEQDARS